MNADLKALLKRSLLVCEGRLRQIGQDESSKSLQEVYTRTGPQSWQTSYQPRLDRMHVFVRIRREFVADGSEFVTRFFEAYPQFGSLVGVSWLGASGFGDDKGALFQSVLVRLLTLGEAKGWGAATVDTVVNDVVEFADRTSLQVRFRAVLQNFNMACDRLELFENLIVRRLGEDEVSSLYGSRYGSISLLAPRMRIDEFVVEGFINAELTFGFSTGMPDFSPIEELKRRLDIVLNSFRTFKPGLVGYAYLSFDTLQFYPYAMASQTLPDRAVAHGYYDLEAHEEDALRKHALSISGISDRSLRLACSRLADAETRIRYEDQFLDAVIGLEAILLAHIGEGERGELSFRFCLNFAMLYDTPTERYAAYRKAKALYKLRSQIAHGGNPQARVDIGDLKSQTLGQAARHATDALRSVLLHFLPQPDDVPFKKPDFWLKAYLGFDRESSE